MYRKGYSVFESGKPGVGLFFLQKGMIREYLEGPKHKIELFRFIKSGQVFGHVVANSHYSTGAEAKMDSVVCFFDYGVLRKLLELNPKSILDLLTLCANDHSESIHRLISIQNMDLRQKVASVLHSLFRQFGVNSEKELPECFNREDIAGLAMTTAEQVSRQLSDFEEEGLIEKRARRIALTQPGKLKSIIKDHLF
jgi:CRP-like cAMP-binding protein